MVTNKFQVLLDCDTEEMSPNELWRAGKGSILQTAKDIIQKKKVKISGSQKKLGLKCKKEEFSKLNVKQMRTMRNIGNKTPLSRG